MLTTIRDITIIMWLPILFSTAQLIKKQNELIKTNNDNIKFACGILKDINNSIGYWSEKDIAHENFVRKVSIINEKNRIKNIKLSEAYDLKRNKKFIAYAEKYRNMPEEYKRNKSVHEFMRDEELKIINLKNKQKGSN